MLSMVEDDPTWSIEDSNKEKINATIKYFIDDNDVIPDHIPGIGYVDDCIVIDGTMDAVEEEMMEFKDFVGPAWFMPRTVLSVWKIGLRSKIRKRSAEPETADSAKPSAKEAGNPTFPGEPTCCRKAPGWPGCFFYAHVSKSQCLMRMLGDSSFEFCRIATHL